MSERHNDKGQKKNILHFKFIYSITVERNFIKFSITQCSKICSALLAFDSPCLKNSRAESVFKFKI